MTRLEGKPCLDVGNGCRGQIAAMRDRTGADPADEVRSRAQSYFEHLLSRIPIKSGKFGDHPIQPVALGVDGAVEFGPLATSVALSARFFFPVRLNSTFEIFYRQVDVFCFVNEAFSI